MTTPALPSAGRWAVFLRERYEPLSHMAMAAAFALGNAGVAVAAAGAAGAAGGAFGATVPSMVVVGLFFLRLRIFDEIKDYRHDCEANPRRPLPRGLISLEEARNLAGLVTVLEAVLATALGWEVGLAWAASYAYSLAMFGEFGIGPWLRPRLELYAISHTLVASLLGLTVATAVTGLPLWRLPDTVWLFAPANWALFNVFEFSRKTFAPTEESESEASYSSRWGPCGAAGITLAWSAVALVLSAVTEPRVLNAMRPSTAVLVFGSIALLIAVPYLTLRRPPAAKFFRFAMSGWATALYLATGVTGLGAAS